MRAAATGGSAPGPVAPLGRPDEVVLLVEDEDALLRKSLPFQRPAALLRHRVPAAGNDLGVGEQFTRGAVQLATAWACGEISVGPASHLLRDEQVAGGIAQAPSATLLEQAIDAPPWTPSVCSVLTGGVRRGGGGEIQRRQFQHLAAQETPAPERKIGNLAQSSPRQQARCWSGHSDRAQNRKHS